MIDMFSYKLGQKAGGGSGGEIALQDKTVTPSAAAQTVTADDGFAGLASVEVAGDSNLSPQNISEGVTIFGVEGKAVAGGIILESGVTWDAINETYLCVEKTTVYGSVVLSYAFSGQPWLVEVVLPDDLTRIGTEAFRGCSRLPSISLPDAVTIESGAFRSCSSLSTLELPAGLTSIEPQTFYSCRKLAITRLPSGITNIGKEAFRGCSDLALTSLPNGLTNIADLAFCDCTNLAVTSIPASVKSIGSSAFYGCTSVANITFEGTPTSIGNNAFDGCTELTVINVPWAEGAVANAPWGATKATINYNYTGA